MKNISLIMLLSAAFLVSCGSRSKKSPEASAFSISIEKTACFGKCPMYKLTVNETGVAELEAKRFTSMDKGTYTAQVSVAVLKELTALVNQAKWDTYDLEYMTGYSDLPSTVVTFSEMDKKDHTVIFESNKGPLNIIQITTVLQELYQSADWNSTDLN